MIKNLCWIRRDLRFQDHHALSEALKQGDETYVVFCFDKNILAEFSNKSDQRISFIYESLMEIEKEFNKFNSSLIIIYGDPTIEIPKLAKELGVQSLFFNRDYEPKAKLRDEQVTKECMKNFISVHTFKDHVFYEKHEVLNLSREVYKVFTPYKNKWLETLHRQETVIPMFNCQLDRLAELQNPDSIIHFNWYKEIGFKETSPIYSGGRSHALLKLDAFKKNIGHYKEGRDYPSLDQTSHLSMYIRMGNLSVREMISFALKGKSEGHQIWLSEIIWRDFYQMILDVYPKVEKRCFKSDYDSIVWSKNSEHFKLWCEGQTGYPIVDSAMRCLNQTGLMHNRLRMVVASFLTKTLLIDWRLGENYFKEKLFDYDLAANNGGWQWSASTGVDAQPYFRIFNPYNQSEKFDSDGEFIRKWCPELSKFKNSDIHFPHDCEFEVQAKAKCIIGKDYPAPIVAYKSQKELALKMFKQALPSQE